MRMDVKGGGEEGLRKMVDRVRDDIREKGLLGEEVYDEQQGTLYHHTSTPT